MISEVSIQPLIRGGISVLFLNYQDGERLSQMRHLTKEIKVEMMCWDSLQLIVWLVVDNIQSLGECPQPKGRVDASLMVGTSFLNEH